MGNDVIYEHCYSQDPFLIALDAQGIDSQEFFPRSPPPGSVTAAGSCASLELEFFLDMNPVPVASALARINEYRTSRIATGMIGGNGTH
jgi:hypothetical protein